VDQTIWMTLTYTRWKEIMRDAMIRFGNNPFGTTALDKLNQRLMLYADNQGVKEHDHLTMPVEGWFLRYLDESLTIEEARLTISQL
jgi:hypothetical protein